MTIIVPLGVLVITVAIDVHKNRLELLWDGWGHREESWLLDHVVVPGEVEDNAVWTELGTELRRQFDHALGCKIGLRFGFIDAGKWPDWVRIFLSRLRGRRAFPGDPLPGSPVRGKIRACRGWGGPLPQGGRRPIVDFNYSKTLVRSRNVGGHWVGTDAAKELIYTRLGLEPSEEGQLFPDGYIHISERFDENFVHGLLIERLKTKMVGSHEIRTFEHVDHSVRNEPIDLLVYNTAAFRFLQLTDERLDGIEKELIKAAEEAKKLKDGRSTNLPVVGNSRLRPRRNFISSGRRGSFWER